MELADAKLSPLELLPLIIPLLTVAHLFEILVGDTGVSGRVQLPFHPYSAAPMACLGPWRRVMSASRASLGTNSSEYYSFMN